MIIRTNLFKDGKRKCLTMSYDDGQLFDRRLVEIFDRNGVRGTFHLNASRFTRDTCVDFEEVKQLYKNHEVSCHSYTHPHMEILNNALAIKQIVDDKKVLEAACGYVVRGMSYPYGTYSDELIGALRAVGMEYSRTTVTTNKFSIPNDFMAWHATCHHRSEQLFELLDKFINPRPADELMLFYVWGHSYEFDRNDNWDRIEEFCEKAGGHEDVWYATNIEIVDYINAQRRLRFSAECDMAYNPTCTDVWVDCDGKPVCIPAGKTVKFEEV